MNYTYLIYSVADGGAFDSIQEAGDPTIGFIQAVSQFCEKNEIDEIDIDNYELIACIEGVAKFATTEGHIKLFPSP